MIQNFGGGELIAIIILVLVVLGPDRIPEMARSAGRMLHKFRTMTEGLQGQVKDVMDDPAMQPLRELGEFAARPRQKLSEYALEAEAEERSKAEQASLESAEPAPPGAADPAAPQASDPPDGAASDAVDAELEPIDAAPVDPAPFGPVPVDDTTPLEDEVPAAPVPALEADLPSEPTPAPATVPVAEATNGSVVDPGERETA